MHIGVRLWRYAAVAPLACAAAGCCCPGIGTGPVEEIALASLLPMTHGGTAIPANGVSVTVMERSEAVGPAEAANMYSAGIAAGIGNRASLSYQTVGRGGKSQTGQVLRLSGRVGDLFGPRTSTKVHAAIVQVRRKDPPRPERLDVIDVAIPTEFFVSRSDSDIHQVGVYGGPRFASTEHHDVVAEHKATTRYYGGLFGLHYRGTSKLLRHSSRLRLHLFAEVSVLKPSSVAFDGRSYGGRVRVMRALGMEVEGLFGRGASRDPRLP